MGRRVAAPDHVNPEAPWPELARLEAATHHGGRVLVERLPIYPGWQSPEWIAPKVLPTLLRHADSDGWGRGDGWHAGDRSVGPPGPGRLDATENACVQAALAALDIGREPDACLIETLFSARGADVERICAVADNLRRQVNGEAVSYVVNRNINYTNICAYACGFCAFSKGSIHEDLRGRPYDLDHGEIARRVREAAARGASEVCLQGGITPRIPEKPTSRSCAPQSAPWWTFTSTPSRRSKCCTVPAPSV